MFINKNKELMMNGKLIALIPLALLISGCDLSSSGVDPEKRLNELTKEERVDLCFYELGFIEDMIRTPEGTDAFCAFTLSNKPAGTLTCEFDHSKCVNGVIQGFNRSELCSDRVEYSDRCDVTVAEFESCFDAIERRSTEHFKTITCSAIASLSFTETLYFTPTSLAADIDECKNIAADCGFSPWNKD